VNAYFESMLVIVNSILLFKSEFSCGVMITPQPEKSIISRITYEGDLK